MNNLVPSLGLTLMLLAAGHTCTAEVRTAETAAENARQEVKTLQGQLIQAILKSDTSVLEKYYADDYVAIHGDGKLTTKAQEIENFKTGTTKYDSIAVREAKIRVYGDTVVVNAWASVKTLVNGRPYVGDVRNTRVWVKDGGDWKLVVFQTTRVEP
jgi:ketosteroid isomerase-like protein